MNKSLIFSILLLLFGFQTVAQSPQTSSKDKRLKKLDKELEQVVKELNMAGLSVAITEGDKVIYAKGFGYRDMEKQLPVDANTLFMIGSSTKAFTSALLGQLYGENKLCLNDSPRKYLDNLEFFNDDLNNNIRIKDMMCHTTGLPRHDFAWYFFPPKSNEEVIAKIKYQEPSTGIREQFQYNNWMFALQGYIAEEILDKDYHTILQEKIFTPLAMNRTSSKLDDLLADNNRALPYINDSTEIIYTDYHKVGCMAGAGSINSSANDMANWVILWNNNGKIGEEDVLPTSYCTQAMSAQAIRGYSIPGTENKDRHFNTYGYGWMQESYRGHYLVQHGGNIDGFSARVSFFPSDKLGIVVLCNQGGSAAPAVVEHIIADRMLKLPKRDWLKQTTDRLKMFKQTQEEIDNTEITEDHKASLRPLTDYTGKFEHPGYGIFTIELNNDSLFLVLDENKAYLNHKTYDVFSPYFYNEQKKEYEKQNHFPLNFRSDYNGDIDAVEIRLEMSLPEPLKFKRVAIEKDLSTDQLDAYCGTYYLAHQVCKVSVKNDSTLVLNISNQPEYTLMAIGDDLFQIKSAPEVKIEFMPNDEQEYNQLKFIQPGGPFVATKKDAKVEKKKKVKASTDSSTGQLSPKKLKQYESIFVFAGKKIKTYLDDNNQLYMHVPNQPKFKLVHEDGHKFNVENLSGYAVEFDMKGKKPKAIKLIQPQGTFIAEAE